MTPDEINISIGTICGWVGIGGCNSPDYKGWIKIGNPHPDGMRRLPDYYHDLNACAEMEDHLEPHQKDYYGGFLYCGKIVSFQDFCNGRMVFEFAHASAPKRCEGFLRVNYRWETDN